MSVTRTPLCPVKVCPFPTDPWAHVCAVCEAPAVHHHHKEPKGMGGSKARDIKENIVMLCAVHHMEEHGIGVSSDGGERSGEVTSGALVSESSPPSPGASSGASTGEGNEGPRRAGPGDLPSPAGASKGLEPEERVGRDSRGATRARDLPAAVTPPDSFACWTLEELRAALEGWKASDEGHDYSYCYDAGTFLDWLGKA